MKTLYLVRHAIAADPGGEYATDEVRPLTQEGIERWRQQVRGLMTLDVTLDRILTSPLVRCRQTAQWLADGVDGSIPIEILDALKPGGRQADVIDGLGAHRGDSSLALVGHEPSIGMLAAALLGAQGSVPFKKGAVCRIDVGAFPPRAPGTLIWMLPPRVLRGLAG